MALPSGILPLSLSSLIPRPVIKLFDPVRVVGEAKVLIDPLNITRDNYKVAWETLLKTVEEEASASAHQTAFT